MDKNFKDLLIKNKINPDQLNDNELLYLEAIESYYSNEGKSLISDSQFDLLEQKIKKENPSLIKFVGSKREGPQTHLSDMLSLDKIQVYNNDDLPITEFNKWFKKTNKAKYIEATVKYDGNAINLIYKKGKLVKALTRSNSKTGFNKKIKLIHIIPMIIPIKETVEIRGEVVIPTKIFKEKYIKSEKNPDGAANERNYVAGVLGSDNIRINQVKELVFVALEMRIHNPIDFEYPEKSMEKLYEIGFNHEYKVPVKYFNTVKEFSIIYKEFLDYRKNKSPFRLDGIVLKTSEEIRINLGFNRHDSEWGIAIKFPPKDSITTIIDIEYNTCGSGEVIPVAILEPLELDGTIVRRATLHGLGSMKRLKANIGAEVLVAKGGDIIPQIYKVTKQSPIKITPPMFCSTCGSAIDYDDKHMWCTNNNCKSKMTALIESGLQILNVKNIGIATIEKLYEVGIKKVEDYFNYDKFNKKQFIKGGGFVEGRALDVIIEAIKIIDNIKLEDAIACLKIKDLGRALSEQVAKYLSGVKYDFFNLNKLAVSKITDKTSIEHKRMKDFLYLLKYNNINVIIPKKEDNKIKELEYFEMTGSPPEIDGMKLKSDYIKHFEPFGLLKSGLTKKCRYLVTNSHESNTSKMKKAKNYGTEIITYHDLYDKING